MLQASAFCFLHIEFRISTVSFRIAFTQENPGSRDCLSFQHAHPYRQRHKCQIAKDVRWHVSLVKTVCWFPCTSIAVSFRHLCRFWAKRNFNNFCRRCSDIFGHFLNNADKHIIVITKWELEDQLHQDVWYKSYVEQTYTKIVCNMIDYDSTGTVQQKCWWLYYIVIYHIICIVLYYIIVYHVIYYVYIYIIHIYLYTNNIYHCFHRTQSTPVNSQWILCSDCFQPSKATSRFCWFAHSTSTETHGEPHVACAIQWACV